MKTVLHQKMDEINAASARLSELMSGEARINDPQTYKDKNGITHVYVFDTREEYKLIDGEWQLQPPF